MNKQFACLIGSPVAHSISPAMHNKSFEYHNINANYEAIDIAKEDLPNIISRFREKDFLGSNVTMPHKTNVIPFMDELHPSAKLSNSVNTIVPRDGKLIGYSTDGAGFIDSLSEIDVNITDKIITIIGAGGAATSIIVQAALDSANTINILKRKSSTYEKTVEFAAEVDAATECTVNVIDLADKATVKNVLDKTDILINATPIGMSDYPGTPIDKKLLNSNLVVADLIYETTETQLLKDAKSLGCKCMNGEFMLLYQGARSFKYWTKLDMPINLIKKEVFHVK